VGNGKTEEMRVELGGGKKKIETKTERGRGKSKRFFGKGEDLERIYMGRGPQAKRTTNNTA